MSQAVQVKEALGLRATPIAIGFLDAPPEGVAAWDGGAVPAGCVFWARAWAGQSFYTVPSDHYNCAIGSYTHSIPLPAERASELEITIGFMVENKYLAMAEVPGIPTLSRSPAVVAYAPLDAAMFTPDVVVVAASPAQAMLLYEAALKAGAGDALTHVLGRPGCAVLPLALKSGVASLSFGCKGNRTFTGLPDSEMYVAIPGDKWAAVAEKLVETNEANACMATFYQGRQAQFAAG